MIFIWKGRGFLTILILIVTFLICLFILPSEYVTIKFALPFLVSGLFSFVFGNKWNSAKYYINPDTDEKTVLKNQHTLFWVNMEYWGLIFVVLGAAFITYSSIITWAIGGISLVLFVVYKYKSNNNIFLSTE